MGVKTSYINMRKYIFITGGVSSSLGKGLAASSLGTLLEAHGYPVVMVKIDPYINVDAGTMSPFQHGEVYVTDDGAETDLDLGNYARYTNSPLSATNSITTGQVYQRVIAEERAGRYLGKCVQVVPHITDEIRRRIYTAHHAFKSENSAKPTIVLVEVGGTVGDLESVPFLESIRQIIHEKKREEPNSTVAIHLTLIAELSNGELKTKPTQHSVKELRAIGIQPQILLCRAKDPVTKEMKDKLAMFTNIDYQNVFSTHDAKHTLYEIPLMQREQQLDLSVLNLLNLKPKANPPLTEWAKRVAQYTNATRQITIGLVGKYINMDDSYKSIDEAIIHAAMANGVQIKLRKIDTQQLSPEDENAFFKGLDAMILSPGFGERGSEEMLRFAKHARENKVPTLGICLGMQIMVIEYARNVLGLTDANSSEFNEDTEHKVISLLEEQLSVVEYGATMRLGLSTMKLVKDSLIAQAYGCQEASERHRHRYEVSNQYREALSKHNLKLTGFTLDDKLVEAVEWSDHPWGVGVQCHPEYTSQPLKPAPLFVGLLKAAMNKTKA